MLANIDSQRKMFGRATCVGGKLASEGRQTVVRNVNCVLKRRSTSVPASQTTPENWENAKPFEEVPGPKPVPIFGNLWRFMPRIGSLHGFGVPQLVKHMAENYGDISKLDGIPGRPPLLILCDAGEIEKVFRNEGPWPVRESVQCFTYFRNVTRKEQFQGVGGLITVQGEEWQKFRTKVNPTMMQPKSTKLYVGAIDTVANDFIKRIRDLRDEKQEMPSDFNNEMYKWSLESIAYIALDTRLGCVDGNLKSDSEPQKMIDAVQVQLDAMYKMETSFPFWKVFSTPTWRAFVKAADYFAEVSQKYINQATERMKTMPADSDRELTVLEKLLARDPDPRTAAVMASDMMAAGIDTTSYTAVIAMYFLAKNQDAQQKLFDEIVRVLPGKEDPITTASLNEMKYLKACLKESMRKQPIVGGNMRALPKDLVIRNYRIPKGTNILMPSLYLSNLDKYFPEADKFMPERWIKGKLQPEKKHHAFVSLPFGFGPRMCIGRRFAELEIETLVAKIVRNFHIEYNYGEMKFENKLLITPSSPLKFKFTDREI